MRFERVMRGLALAAGLGAAALLAGCAGAPGDGAATAPASAPRASKFEQDRRAILAMTGNFQVRFDFRETVALAPGYELRPPKLSGAYEIIRLVEDRGTFISLQHLLVVGEGEDTAVVKHWRQDWRYEPTSVLVFIGGNAWRTRPVPASQRAGEWSQTVYQVEDSPRYGAVGAWTHENGVSQWNPPVEMRPLPRRDMTTRDDYDAVLAVNRHTVTPWGWAQEEENSKLVLRGDHHVLAREIGINSYRRFDGFNVAKADAYWNATRDFWRSVRADWSALERSSPAFGLTVQGEPEPLYIPILELADKIEARETTTEAAAVEARAVIARLTTRDIGTLESRIAAATAPARTAAN
jgi:hypothetical protein